MDASEKNMLVVAAVCFGVVGFMVSVVHIGRAVKALLRCCEVARYGSELERNLRGNSYKSYARALLRGKTGLRIELAQVVLSLLGSAFYVLDTYFEDESHPLGLSVNALKTIDFVFALFFFACWSLRIYAALDPVSELLSRNAMLEVVTIVPPVTYLAMDVSVSSIVFLRAVRLMRVLRILHLLRLRAKVQSNLQRELSQVGLLITAIVFILTSVYQTIALDEDPAAHMPWHVALFYMVGSTMGRPFAPSYGDISTLFLTGVIIFAIIFIPINISRLFTIYQREHSDFRAPMPFSAGRRHVVLAGELTTHGVMQFINEFFHEDKELQEMAAVALLMRAEPPLDMVAFVRNCEYAERITLVRGDVFEEEDLALCRASQASAVLLYTDVHAANMDAQDDSSIARACSLKNFFPHVPLLVQLLLRENHEDIVGVPGWRVGVDMTVIVHELRFAAMAASALCPGICTFVANLLTSHRPRKPPEAPWLKEYVHGFKQEMYRATLHPALDVKTFAGLVGLVYRRLGMIVMAVELQVGGVRRVLLNPGPSYELSGASCVYVLAESDLAARRVGLLTGTDVDESLDSVSKHTMAVMLARQQTMIEEMREIELFGDHRVTQRKRAKDRAILAKLLSTTKVGVGQMLRVGHRKREDRHTEALSGVAPVLTFSRALTLGRAFVNKIDMMDAPDESSGASQRARTCVAVPSVLQNHIVLLGNGWRVTELLRSLDAAARGLPPAAENRPVVIVTESMTKRDLNKVLQPGGLEHVYLVEGSPTHFSTLRAARAQFASRAIVLSTSRAEEEGLHMDAEERSRIHDAMAVVAMRKLKVLNPEIWVLTEVTKAESVRYLYSEAATARAAARAALGPPSGDPSDIDYSDFRFSAPAAAGQAFFNQLANNLFLQAYFDNVVYDLIHSLLLPNFSSTHSLQLIPLSDEQVGCTFEEVMNNLVSGGFLPLAIYRHPLTHGTEAPFVYTCPRPDAVLEHGDRLMVLQSRGHMQPKMRWRMAIATTICMNRPWIAGGGASPPEGRTSAELVRDMFRSHPL